MSAKPTDPQEQGSAVSEGPSREAEKAVEAIWEAYAEGNCWPGHVAIADMIDAAFAARLSEVEAALLDARMDFEGRKCSEEASVAEANRLLEELEAARERARVLIEALDWISATTQEPAIRDYAAADLSKVAHTSGQEGR